MSWVAAVAFIVAVWLVKDIAVIAISVRGASPSDRAEILTVLHESPALASRPVVAAWQWVDRRRSMHAKGGE